MWVSMQLVQYLLYILSPFRWSTERHKYAVGYDSAHDHNTEQFTGCCQGGYLFHMVTETIMLLINGSNVNSSPL